MTWCELYPDVPTNGRNRGISIRQYSITFRPDYDKITFVNTERIVEYIIADTGLDEFKVNGVLSLVAKGSTVPFIARYRKEETGGLDEVRIRDISEKFAYYAELEARKAAIIKSIESQGKMPDGLAEKIASCKKKYILEDIYVPYKPKQRTRATTAREKGLEPLADMILMEQPASGNKKAFLERFVSQAKAIPTPEAALEEALEIVIERIADDADTRSRLRELYGKKGVLLSNVLPELAGTKTKYETYYSYSELISKVPSHRMLAIRRGSKEKVLSWEITVPEAEVHTLLKNRFINNTRSIFYPDLCRAMEIAYKRSIKTSIEVEIFRMKMEEAEKEAIKVFSTNLRNLLLAPPAGHRIILGVDPGMATGAKLAVVGKNGEFMEYRQIFLHASERQKLEAAKVLVELVTKHGIELIAVGNGTGSKETFAFVKDAIKSNGFKAKALVVSEAGASVYSASDAARMEFPALDVTVRGAISIARRLQDPLADLVKIDPKSIGVGQYQHDVNQSWLKKELDATVDSCVNFVGVELNTASYELLMHVSGIGSTLAAGIVSYRKHRGAFAEKGDLLKVPMLGPKAFEQCAGFLKVRQSRNPLDNSTIHPERFELVGRIASDLGAEVKTLIGNEDLITKIDINRYVSDSVGVPTLTDIVNELKKPGVDPREEFDTVEFSESVNSLDDLSVGMVLNGVITNVTNFGAFVDIGIHHDGLMHVSQMSDRFVKDPHQIVSVGDRIKAKVIAVDKSLERISLEMYRG